MFKTLHCKLKIQNFKKKHNTIFSKVAKKEKLNKIKNEI